MIKVISSRIPDKKTRDGRNKKMTAGKGKSWILMFVSCSCMVLSG
jgi:hypothetical protein